MNQPSVKRERSMQGVVSLRNSTPSSRKSWGHMFHRGDESLQDLCGGCKSSCFHARVLLKWRRVYVTHSTETRSVGLRVVSLRWLCIKEGIRMFLASAQFFGGVVIKDNTTHLQCVERGALPRTSTLYLPIAYICWRKTQLK